MLFLDLLVVALTFVLGVLLTWMVRRHALTSGMLDVPNARSSHLAPTPRGGGLAIVGAVFVATVYFWWRGWMSAGLAISILVGGSAVAGIGYLDDARGLSARVRFMVHLAASVLGIVLLGGLTLAEVLFPAIPAAMGSLLLVLAVSWSINLFNFMDGIDGIAASEFVFVVAAAALLYSLMHGFDGRACLLLACAAAAGGFLVLNWAPAKIFMGDVGSGFLGYLIALLALSFAIQAQLPLWSWVILYVIFVADSSVTLLRRAWSGAKWFEAHRSHVYQQLSRKWASHARVCKAIWAANMLVLLPIAYYSAVFPQSGFLLASIVLCVFGCLFFMMGGGRPELSNPNSR